MKRKLAAAFLALCAIGFAAFADEYEDGPTVFAPGHILTNSLDALPFSSPRLFSLPPSPIVDTPPDSPATSTNFVGGENTIFTPPDTMGAVGPNHVMTMING